MMRRHADPTRVARASRQAALEGELAVAAEQKGEDQPLAAGRGFWQRTATFHGLGRYEAVGIIGDVDSVT